MGRRLLAQSLLILLVGGIVSLLPLHRDVLIPVSVACPAARSEMCRLKYEACPDLHPGFQRQRHGARACAVEYAVRCRPYCGDPLLAGTYIEGLRRFGPWWLALLPGGVSWWEGLQGDGTGGEP